MRYRHLPHTDICRNVDFQTELNNAAYVRMENKRREEKERIASCFRAFLNMFSHKSMAYNLQMAHFWRWLITQAGAEREYKYTYAGEYVTEVLVLLRVEEHNEGVIVTYKTKSGKKEWREFITDSPFFRHWKTANEKAGRYIID